MKSIKSKIVLGFSIIICILLSFSAYSIYSIQQTTESIEQLRSEKVPVVIMRERLALNIAERLALSNNYVLAGRDETLQQFEELTTESKALENWLAENTNDDEINELIIQSDVWATLLETEIFVRSDTEDNDQAIRMLSSQVTPLANRLMEGHKEGAEREEQELSLQLDEMARGSIQLLNVTAIIAGSVFVLSIMIALFMANLIVKPLKMLLQRVKIVATGDLSMDQISIRTKDEVGQLSEAFNDMTGSLRSLLKKTWGMSDQVAATAEQLSASSQETAAATNQIAGAIQTVSTASEQGVRQAKESSISAGHVNDGIHKITEAANGVEQLADEASRQALEGEEAIEQAAEQINTIQQTVTQAAELIHQLGEQSKEIDQVVTLITTIAEQTNLLALNAAIEAARAGEHGKGFAVVADEVRKLAEESRQSAQKIAGMLELIQKGTVQAVDEMSKGTAEVEAGTKAVHKVGESFTSIAAAIERVTGEMSHVSAATKQILQHTGQLNEALTSMEYVSVQNAESAQAVAASAEEQLASMEEIASSAEALSQLSVELQGAVGKFTL
ncbi:methyl-accepting chemotaxis protein [Alkalihalobacillus oceani]|uniref:Methyl-accepting chemotaxis protein n=1 Tax=Halalkalibacter oceani TaxID=1653776 RepID=A0A9X2IQT2_9BACI|nr:methyl-accepting chemotaxis protein [Halalkalibacter oceani]MCM3715762.1 methyl-accepting chemotaxis protein [Halalkalibacter oceani]